MARDADEVVLARAEAALRDCKCDQVHLVAPVCNDVRELVGQVGALRQQLAEAREALRYSEHNNRELARAAQAYCELCACYRLGTRPSEKLFRRLGAAQEAMDEAREMGWLSDGRS